MAIEPVKPMTKQMHSMAQIKQEEGHGGLRVTDTSAVRSEANIGNLMD